MAAPKTHGLGGDGSERSSCDSLNSPQDLRRLFRHPWGETRQSILRPSVRQFCSASTTTSLAPQAERGNAYEVTSSSVVTKMTQLSYQASLWDIIQYWLLFWPSNVAVGSKIKLAAARQRLDEWQLICQYAFANSSRRNDRVLSSDSSSINNNLRLAEFEKWPSCLAARHLTIPLRKSRSNSNTCR
jgi:hypothetical protein